MQVKPVVAPINLECYKRQGRGRHDRNQEFYQGKAVHRTHRTSLRKAGVLGVVRTLGEITKAFSQTICLGPGIVSRETWRESAGAPKANAVSRQPGGFSTKCSTARAAAMVAFARARSSARTRLKPSKYRPNTRTPAESTASATQTSIKVKPDFAAIPALIAGSIQTVSNRRL